MGTEFRLTTGPTRVTQVPPYTLSCKEAPDALAYDHADFFLIAYEVAGASPSITVHVQTSMQNVSDDDVYWSTVVTFTTITSTTVPASERKNLPPSTGMLRYLRWKVVFAGTTTAFTFDLTGIGRAG